jgi:tripartite-type tricarboxylate transporter receptor subunit TctC
MPAQLTRLFLASALIAVAVTGSKVNAQVVYPSHPVKIIIPGPTGGPGGLLAHLLSEPLGKILRQPVVIEFVPGANGTIGANRVASAAPDGYTILLSNWNTQLAASAFYPVKYDVLKDFEPISMLAVSRLWLVARKDFPAKNAAELINWLRANPNKASTAFVGAGSAAHICGTHFQNLTQTQLQFVFYRGGGPAYQDLVGGHVDLMCAETTATLPLVRAGQIKAYALMARERWAEAPDVPTMDEVGVPSLYIPWWQGLWAPKATPKEIVAKLNDAAVEALIDPVVVQRFKELGLELPDHEQQTPVGLGAYHREQIGKWWPIIKAMHIKAE